MTRPKKTTGGSRHGKHAPDMFRVSLYLSSEEKAIAILTAELQEKTISDVLRNGVEIEAARSEIVANGRIAEKFRERVEAYKRVLEAEAQIRKER